MTTKVKRPKYDKQNPKIWKFRVRVDKLMFVRIAHLCSIHKVTLSELVRTAITEKYMREFNNTNNDELKEIDKIIDIVESKTQR